MRAVTKLLAGGVAAGALFASAPASAQYYPSPYGYGPGGVIGQVINSVIGGGYGGGAYSQQAVSQCAGAVQQRLSGGYAGGYGGYGYNNGYGGYGYTNGYAGAYGGGRVLGISRVEQRPGGGLTVRGVANSGRNAGYGYGYGGAYAQPQVDLVWKCKTDYRGLITDIDVDPAQTDYGYNYTPYNYDYSQYGYRRY